MSAKLKTKDERNITMDHIFNMISFFYYILNRLVDLYCYETVDTDFDKTSKKLERIIKKYIKEYELT